MIKRRNMWMQVVLMIITLGIYSIYWFYSTAREMLEYQQIDGRPGLWTVLLFVPFGSFYSYWKHSTLVDSLTNSKYNVWLIYVLWVFLGPAVWAITQVELNRLADQGA